MLPQGGAVACTTKELAARQGGIPREGGKGYQLRVSWCTTILLNDFVG
jgi:hypothetical protein